jgi:hypothetical protein
MMLWSQTQVMVNQPEKQTPINNDEFLD